MTPIMGLRGNVMPAKEQTPFSLSVMIIPCNWSFHSFFPEGPLLPDATRNRLISYTDILYDNAEKVSFFRSPDGQRSGGRVDVIEVDFRAQVLFRPDLPGKAVLRPEEDPLSRQHLQNRLHRPESAAPAFSQGRIAGEVAGGGFSEARHKGILLWLKGQSRRKKGASVHRRLLKNH